MGAFDDLIPQGGGAFDDLIPQAPKRSVGASEALGRSASQRSWEGLRNLMVVPGAIAKGIDELTGLFADQPSTRAQDAYFSTFVDPLQQQSEQYRFGPGEELTTGGKAGNVAGTILGMGPEIALGGVATKATAAPSALSALMRTMLSAQPVAQSESVNEYLRLREAGVDQDSAAKASLAKYATDSAGFALPLGMPGNIAKRALTGAGVGTVAGLASTEAERPFVDPSLLPSAAESAGMGGGIGAAMAAVLGSRARPRPVGPDAELGQAFVRDREAFEAQDQAERTRQAAAERYRPTLEAHGIPDLASPEAQAKIDALLAREARQDEVSRPQPEPPPEAFVVDPQGRAARGVEAEGRIVPEGVRAGTDESGILASMLSQEGSRAGERRSAATAFDIAEQQRARKQEAQDRGAIIEEDGRQVDPRDLREARASGTTTKEGTQALQPEEFTFLDAQVSKGQMTGEQVEVLETGLFIKDGKDTVPAVRIRVGDKEIIVAADRLTTASRPKNPRFAQDVAATTYPPPKGVGLGQEQPAPRVAAQRITTEPSPEITLRAQPKEGPSQPRQGEDVTDLAFDRVGRQQVPGEQGIPRLPGRASEGRAPEQPVQRQEGTAAGQPRPPRENVPMAGEPEPRVESPTEVEKPEPKQAQEQGRPPGESTDGTSARPEEIRAEAQKAEDQPASEQKQDAAVETFSGQYGKGMNKQPARLAQQRLAKERPDLDWRVEESGLEHPFVVRGYKKADTAKQAEPATTEEKLLGELGNLRDGPGTLSGGFVPKPLADAIARAFSQSPKFVKDWLANVRDALGIVADPKARTPNRIAAMGRALAMSAEAQVRGLGVYGAPEGFNKLADLIFERPGMARSENPAFEPERRRIYNVRMAAVEDALKGLTLQQAEQVIKQIRAGTAKAGTMIGDAAMKVKKALKDHGNYLVENGASEGLVKERYFPRRIDEGKVMDNADGFRKDAVKAYLAEGLSSKDAEAAADNWMTAIRLGEMGIKAEDFQSRPQGTTSSLKPREFGSEAERILSKWYLSDPYQVLQDYFWKTTSAAELKRLLGKDGEKWKALKQEIIDAGGGQGIPDAIDMLSRVFGVNQARPNAASRGLLAASKLWTPLMLLDRATLTSIPDTVMPALRAGKPHLALKSFAGAIKVMIGKGAEEKVQFARFWGALQSGLDASIYASRMSMDYTPGKGGADTVLAKYFSLNLMHNLTNASRTMAVDFGKAFLSDHAAHVLAKDSQQKSSRLFLSELVPESQLDEFAKWISDIESGKTPIEQAIKNEKMAAAYGRALVRFADQSSMLPTRAERPSWASTPQGSIVYELSSFSQSFFKNVVARAGRLSMDALKGDRTAQDRAALLAPAIGLGLLPIIQYGQYELRDLLFPPDRPKGTDAKVIRAITGTGVLGQAERVVNAFTGARYGTDPATVLVGPFYGQVLKAVASTLGLVDEKIASGADALFSYHYKAAGSPSTNYAERNAAKALYDVGVEPVAALLASTMPGGRIATALGAASIQFFGHPKVKELFVSTLAGEKQERGGARGRPQRESRASTR